MTASSRATSKAFISRAAPMPLGEEVAEMASTSAFASFNRDRWRCRLAQTLRDSSKPHHACFIGRIATELVNSGKGVRRNSISCSRSQTFFASSHRQNHLALTDLLPKVVVVAVGVRLQMAANMMTMRSSVSRPRAAGRSWHSRSWRCMPGNSLWTRPPPG